MNRTLAVAILAACSLSACATHRGHQKAPEFSDAMATHELARLSEDFWDFEMRRNPIWATYLADRRFDELLPDLSPEGRASALKQARFLYDSARRVDPKVLSAEDRVTREAMLAMLDGYIQSDVCKLPLWDVNALDGVQTTLGELPSLHGISTPEHAASLLTRYQKSGAWLDQHVANLKVGVEQGYLSTKVGVQRVIVQLEKMMAGTPEASPFVSMVRLPEDWDEAKRKEVLDGLTRAVRDVVFPALGRYRDYLRDEYLAKARDKVGVKFNKDGEACYRARILAHTHLELGPDEIHAIGLQQAEANLQAMKGIAKKVVGTEDVAALKAHLAEDPALRVQTREDLMRYAEGIIARAREAVSKVLGRRPKLDVKVKAIEEFREQSSPTGYYYSGSEKEARPGYFYLNTYAPQTRQLYLLQSLTFHETIPGHHTQGALAQELEGLPRFRRELGDGAFTEGWAHYAELLADDLGLYEGDAGRFGMYSDQALRAVRLVVDTGMHHKGWTREQALDYALSHTAEPRAELEREIDRYIVWPGQALAYKLGQLEILELRKEAKDALGAKFDLKDFHDEVLGHGAVPLPVLRELIHAWIAEEKAKD